MTRVSLAAVRATYSPDKRWSELEGDFPSFLLYRPISMLLTPPLARLGVTPMMATAAALGLSLALPCVAWFGGGKAFLTVSAMVIAIHVLDCVDGNLARVLERTSRLGELLDGFGDRVFWACYFLAIGLLVDAREGRLGTGVALALGLAVLVLLHRNLRDTYATLFGVRAEFRATPPTRLSWVELVRIVFSGCEGLYVFAVLVGGAFERLDAVLFGIAVYVVAVAIAAVALTMRAAWQGRNA